MEEQRGPSLLGRAVRLLLGLTLAVLLGVGLGVLGYVGLPWLYAGFTEPMATRIAQQEAELAGLRATLDQVGAQESERLAELDARLATQSAVQQAQQAQIAGLEADLQESQRSLSGLSTSRDRLSRLEAALRELSGQVDELQALVAEGVGPLDQLERRMLLTQASLHMLRARLWLIENNAGLTAEELEASRALLARAVEDAPAADQDPLTQVLARLELTLEDLQLRPLIAADDLEIAWQLLTELLAPTALPPE